MSNHFPHPPDGDGRPSSQGHGPPISQATSDAFNQLSPEEQGRITRIWKDHPQLSLELILLLPEPTLKSMDEEQKRILMHFHTMQPQLSPFAIVASFMKPPVPLKLDPASNKRPKRESICNISVDDNEYHFLDRSKGNRVYISCDDLVYIAPAQSEVDPYYGYKPISCTRKRFFYPEVSTHSTNAKAYFKTLNSERFLHFLDKEGKPVFSDLFSLQDKSGGHTCLYTDPKTEECFQISWYDFGGMEDKYPDDEQASLAGKMRKVLMEDRFGISQPARQLEQQLAAPQFNLTAQPQQEKKPVMNAPGMGGGMQGGMQQGGMYGQPPPQQQQGMYGGGMYGQQQPPPQNSAQNQMMMPSNSMMGGFGNSMAGPPPGGMNQIGGSMNGGGFGAPQQQLAAGGPPAPNAIAGALVPSTAPSNPYALGPPQGGGALVPVKPEPTQPTPVPQAPTQPTPVPQAPTQPTPHAPPQPAPAQPPPTAQTSDELGLSLEMKIETILWGMNMEQLKEELRRHGLKVSGLKKDLIDRLTEHYNSMGDDLQVQEYNFLVTKKKTVKKRATKSMGKQVNSRSSVLPHSSACLYQLNVLMRGVSNFITQFSNEQIRLESELELLKLRNEELEEELEHERARP